MYDTLTLIGKISGTIAGLAIIVKSLLIVADLTFTLKTLLRIMPNLESSAKLAPLVDVLLREFRPNGGSSMKDQVTKISLQVDMAHHEAGAARNEAAAAKKEALSLKEAMVRQDKVLAKISEGVTKNRHP